MAHDQVSGGTCLLRSHVTVNGVGPTVTEEETRNYGVTDVMAASSVNCAGYPNRPMHGFRAKHGESRPNRPLCHIAIGLTTATCVIITHDEPPSHVIADGAVALGVAASRGSCLFSCSGVSDGGTTNVSLAMSGAVTVCSYGCTIKVYGRITVPTAVAKTVLLEPVHVPTYVERQTSNTLTEHEGLKMIKGQERKRIGV